MVELHLLFGLLRVDPVLLLGIRTLEGSLISMKTVMGKGAPFGNLAFPGILKCLGCRMSGSDILLRTDPKIVRIPGLLGKLYLKVTTHASQVRGVYGQERFLSEAIDSQYVEREGEGHHWNP